jgi:hypothetical protein
MNAHTMGPLNALPAKSARATAGGEPADAASARRLLVPCSIELAHTPDDFYAHVVLDGVEVGPGDEVLVHNAPTTLAYGEHRVCDTQATVSRATWWGRAWTRLTARFELTMLYEVSFSTARFASSARKPYPRPYPRRPLVRPTHTVHSAAAAQARHASPQP